MTASEIRARRGGGGAGDARVLLLGRNDHWVPPEVGVEYFEALDAPSEELVWFEHSGHEPFADDADKFNSSMVELVRPVLSSHPPTPPV